MSKSDKRVRIFAGPNGSGKTTLFKEFEKKYSTGYFINADEFQIQLETKGFIDLNPIWHNPAVLSKAIKLADRTYLFDNSGKRQQLILEVYKGETFKIHSFKIPLWIKLYVLDKFNLA